jgi:hypothetical protein
MREGDFMIPQRSTDNTDPVLRRWNRAERYCIADVSEIPAVHQCGPVLCRQ